MTATGADRGPDCAAPPRICGTPSGWRAKGRCPLCRQAHNEETAARRRARTAPAPEAIAAFVQHLRDGLDSTEAARQAGIHPVRARALAQDHPEVAQALAGGGRPASPRTRQVAFLKALLDHSGNASRAAAAAGVSTQVVTYWRHDPAFDAAVQAVRAFAGRPAPKPRRTHRFATKEKFELYLKYLEQGLTKGQAAERAELGTASIFHRAANDPVFAARQEAIRPKTARNRSSARMAISEEHLKKLWADGSLTLAAIADTANLTVGQLRHRAKRMGLPARSKRR